MKLLMLIIFLVTAAAFLGNAQDYGAIRNVVRRSIKAPRITEVTNEYLGCYLIITSTGDHLEFELSKNVSSFFELPERQFWKAIEPLLEEKQLSFPENTVIVYPILYQWVLKEKKLKPNLKTEIDHLFPKDRVFSNHSNVRLENYMLFISFDRVQ